MVPEWDHYSRCRRAGRDCRSAPCRGCCPVTRRHHRKPATRVTEAAAALGYRPNAQARSLRLTRTHTIGLLVSDGATRSSPTSPTLPNRPALGADYVTLLGNANENVEQQDRYLETFLTQRVDGILLAPQGRGAGTLDSTDRSPVCRWCSPTGPWTVSTCPA